MRILGVKTFEITPGLHMNLLMIKQEGRYGKCIDTFHSRNIATESPQN